MTDQNNNPPLVNEVLALAGLGGQRGMQASMKEAVAGNHPPLGDLFPQYLGDPDNPKGQFAVVYRDNELVHCPDGFTEAQRQAIELVRHFIPSGEVRLTQTQVSRILNQMRGEAAHYGCGGSTIPMTCTGPYCPLVQDAATMQAIKDTGAGLPLEMRDLSRCKCTLYETGTNPFSRPCPLEVLRDAVLRRSLYDSLEIAPSEEAIHVHLISNLVGWMVLQQRILIELGIDPKMMVESETNATVIEGQVYILKKKEVNPLIFALDICQKHIDSLRKQLIATPEAKTKLRPRDQKLDAQPILTLKGKGRRELQEGVTYSTEDLLTQGGGS